MAKLTFEVFHTQSKTSPSLSFPKLAKGYEQWLGDGYYFWQDEQFARWWGVEAKCKNINSDSFTIYLTTIEVDEEDFIDTVFNEEDYYNFVQLIESFADACNTHLGKQPTLKEFNNFIEDFHLWENIKVVRFQDLPQSREHIKVKGFYYKKRIQIRVNDPTTIVKFVVYKDLACN